MNMRNTTSIIALLLAFAFALPVQAQFRSSIRTANKEFELHAYNLAVESYQQALERKADDLEALSKIAYSYMMLNKMTQAHQYYSQAVRDRKVSAATKLEHAHVLRALGRYDEAKQWYLAYARDNDAVVGNHFAQACDFANAQTATAPVFQATPSPMNSASADFGPSFAGQDQVVYNSARTDRGGSFDGQSRNYPFVSVFGAAGTLQEPFLLRNGYTDNASNVGPVSYSADGTQVVFTRNNFTDGTRMVPGSGMNLILMIADVNPSGGWVNARPLPFNTSDASSGFGTFSPDGSSIYFASDRPEGYGGYDIYRADRQGNNWSTVPENLGTVINSVGDEITPYFDGLSLYFSSDWHLGMGTFDVFRTELVNGRPNNLFHMGNGINSPRDDYGFIYDPVRNLGYVVSNRVGGGRGNEDLYRITPAGNSLAIVVKSASDGTPVASAIVDFTACGDQAYLADVNGRYAFTAVAGLNCVVTVSKEGYAPTTINLNIQDNKQTGEIPVLLNKTSESFQGQVINAQTRLPIPSARVVLINRSNGVANEVYTDANGGYGLAMQPYNTYDISIVAQGYETLSFPLAMGDGSNRNVLGVLSLLPGQGIPGTNPGGQVTTGGGQVTSGYSVQMASVSKAPSADAFNSLSDLGQVYTVNQGNAYKVRMGVYQTRAEAERAQAELKKRGYPGAFIVTDTGGSAVAAPTTPAVNPTTTPSYGSGPFFVQLGAYSTPRFFNATKAQELGAVIQRQRGNLTLMLLDGGADVNAARMLQTRARNAGFDGAFVVEDVNGTLQKVRQ